jgi:3-hydroxyisobutyrate dehydrogenase
LWFGNVVATAEVLLLAGKLGLDLGTLQTVLAGSPAGSEFIRNYLPNLLAGDYLPSFPIDRVVEELQSVSDLAHAHGVPFTVNAAVLGVHQRSADRYGGVDGELLAAALLEEQAQLLIRGDPEARG